MAARAHLLGTWISDKGNVWTVKKSWDKFLSIEFHIVTTYKDFGFNSDFIYGEENNWHRFDPESFQDLIERFKLVKN
jgi:hypothetical protein